MEGITLTHLIAHQDIITALTTDMALVAITDRTMDPVTIAVLTTDTTDITAEPLEFRLLIREPKNFGSLF